jgi:hypothetical protein
MLLLKGGRSYKNEYKPNLIDCCQFRVHPYWQKWQPSLYKTNSDSEVYLEGKKRLIYLKTGYASNA